MNLCGQNIVIRFGRPFVWKVFEVEFSHTPTFGAMIRTVERTQLWYSFALLECIADLQTAALLCGNGFTKFRKILSFM